MLLANHEIKNLIAKRVIVECDHEPGEFISPIFTVPKKDENVRLILNLKKLNVHSKTFHFKMENISTILELVTANCWMASLELKYAYYSVKVDPQYQKYLKFTYHGTMYKYTALPNGLSICTRNFTKLMKPPLAKIRVMNHILSGYIVDFYLQVSSYSCFARDVIDTVMTFDTLGFVIHPEKSKPIPKQELTILGFVINSITMTVRLAEEKRVKIKPILKCTVEHSCNIQIIQLAKVIGYFVSGLPGVQYGALYYRYLEMDKESTLKASKGDFDTVTAISVEGIIELKWWLNHLDINFTNLQLPPIKLTLSSDVHLKDVVLLL